MNNPYKAECRSPSLGIWCVVDNRTRTTASYPTTKANAKLEAATLNRAYAECAEAA